MKRIKKKTVVFAVSKALDAFELYLAGFDVRIFGRCPFCHKHITVTVPEYQDFQNSYHARSCIILKKAARKP